jgi:hypothetical protein
MYPSKFDGSPVDGVLPPTMSAISPTQYSRHSPTIALVLLQFLEQCLYCGLEQGNVPLYRIPDHIQVDGKIPMHEDIADADNLVPGNVGGQIPISSGSLLAAL